MAFFDTAWYVDLGVTAIDLGSTYQASGATLAFTPNGPAIPPGSCVVFVVCEAGATSNGAVSDGVNTYSLVASQTLGGSSGQLQVFRAYNAAAIGQYGASVTYTKVGSANKCSMSGFAVTNVLSTSDPVDASVTVSGNGTTTTPSLTSGTPSVAGELFVCALGINSTGTTYTQSGGLAAPPDNQINETTCQIAGGSLINPGTSAYVFAPTVAATVTGTASIIIGLKPKTGNVGWTKVPVWKASTSISAGALCRQFTPPTAGNERVYVCVAAGTTSSAEPAWTLTRGVKITDNTVTWQECTGAAGVNGDLTNCPKWAAVKAQAVTLGQIIQNAAGTYLFICSTAGTAGSGSEPTWNTAAGATTTDNTITWTSLGAVGNFPAWSAPHARICNAYAATWGAAGNLFNVGDNHVEAGAPNAQTPPGSTGLPAYVVSVDHTQPVPPPALAGATIYGPSMYCAYGVSNAYYYGLSWVNTGAYGSGYLVVNDGAGQHLIFDTCTFDCGTGNGAIDVNYAYGSELVWLNCNTNFSGTAQGNGLGVNQGLFTWRGGAVTGLTYNLTWIATGNTQSATITIEGVDLSKITGALISGYATKALFKDCKLASSFTWNCVSDVQLDFVNCDSGATNYRTERHRAEGDQTTSTSVVRTGGFAIEGTACARQIVTSANASWGTPFPAIPMAIRNGLVGSLRNVTLYGIVNAASVPTNAQFWFDVEYLGSSTSPKGSIATGGIGTYTTAATALSADTSAWDSEGTARANSTAYVLGNAIVVSSNPGRVFFCTTAGASAASLPAGYASAVDGGSVTDGTAVFRAGCRFKLTVSITAEMAGLLTIYPKMALASAQLIYDPMPVLS